jgi:hypothetical protein
MLLLSVAVVVFLILLFDPFNDDNLPLNGAVA